MYLNKPIRVFFEKTGLIKYISHLDLQRTMQRALKRAGIPVWETEGFNPHVYLTFALPLSLGIESVCESFDVKLTADISNEEIRDKLNAVLTDELRIIKAAEPVYKPTEIEKAEYDLILPGVSRFTEYLAQDKIIITKKTKKGQALIDLKPLIELKQVNSGHVTLIMPAGSKININPNQVIESYKAFINEPLLHTAIKRTAIYCIDNEPFN